MLIGGSPTKEVLPNNGKCLTDGTSAVVVLVAAYGGSILFYGCGHNGVGPFFPRSL